MQARFGPQDHDVPTDSASDSLLYVTYPLLLVVAVSSPAEAEAPTPWRALGSLAAEIGGDALAGDDLDAMKAADLCAQADTSWQQAMDRGTVIEAGSELLAAPVDCWGGADKKAARASAAFAPVAAYVAAQRAYVESMRAYLSAVQAQYLGGGADACKQIEAARTKVAAASRATDGVVEGFRGVAAKKLASEQAQGVEGVNTAIAAVSSAAKCD